MKRPPLPHKEPRWLLVLPPMGRVRAVGLSLVQAFQQELGESARIYDTQEALRRIHGSLKPDEDEVALDWMNQQLIVRLLEWRITHVLVLSLAPISSNYLDLMRELGIRTIHWFYEDQRIADYWRSVMAHYDLFCSNQLGTIQREFEQGHAPFHYLPLGARQRPETGTLQPFEARTWDVVMLGSRTPYRVKVLESLAAAGLNLGIFGEGWAEEQGMLARYVVTQGVDDDERVVDTLFRQGRLYVFLSRSGEKAVVDLRMLPPSIWDAVAMGAYPVIERMPVNLLSLDGIKFHEYDTATSLLATCVALRHNGVAQEVLESNREAAIRKHTLNRRLRSILEWIEDQG